MIREAKGTGATVNEAQENAVKALGADIDADIQFEVISFPKKKVLGIFGGCDAEVRAYIELPDEKPKRENRGVKKNKETKQNKKPVKKETPVKEEKEPENYVDADTLPADSQAGKAVAYVKNILESLGCTNFTAKAVLRDNGMVLTLDGENIGVIIGRRGETLDAIQYLASLAANDGSGYFRVSLNIGNYREKREQTLVSLANRVAAQVLSSNRSRKLEPMNPYERRIIHTAVQSIEGVTTFSIGEGNSRRVVIALEGESQRERRAPRKDNKKPSKTVASAPTREPKKDTDIPLYGKIN